MAAAQFTSLSDVYHDGYLVLAHGDEVTAAKRKELGDKLLDELYDSGVIVETALLPPHWKARPEGNTDRTGFRVPSLSEAVAAADRADAEAQEKGQTREVKAS